jgi:hypothetical protein
MKLEHHLVQLHWIRAEQYCLLTGESIDTVRERIRDGEWAGGKHYKRTGPRTLWISIPAINQWIDQQPLVEPYVPKELKSARARAATA